MKAHSPIRRAALALFLTCAVFLALPAVAASAQPVNPNRGEGIISMTKRTCGSSSTWQANAAANGITQSSGWLVLFGKTYDINCAASPAQPAAQQPQPQAPAASSQVWFHPVPGHCPSTNTGYGGGAYWAGRSYGHHQGQDFAAGNGTPIHAIGGGTITYAGYSGGAGNQIQMRIGNLTIKYNHLSSFRRTGGWVSPNEVIGYVGATGNATGPHLHLEVWPLQNPVNFLGSVGVSRCG